MNERRKGKIRKEKGFVRSVGGKVQACSCSVMSGERLFFEGPSFAEIFRVNSQDMT